VQALPGLSVSIQPHRDTPAGVLFEDGPQLHGQGLPPCQRNGHVRDKSFDVACELPVGGVSTREFFGVAEVGATDGILAGLNVPAPVAGLCQLWCASIPFRLPPFCHPYARFSAANLSTMHRGAGSLVDGASGLPGRGFGINPLAP
jgi:hypothetical protein